jgi:outer membrane protein assembly factor BamA
VNEEYGKRGYIRETTAYEPKLDDSRQRAVFDIAVTEGPQFHMGTLTVSGIAGQDAAALTKQWPLKSGDVFDLSAARKYEVDVLLQVRAANGAHPVAQLRPDAATQVVDVTVMLRQ